MNVFVFDYEVVVIGAGPCGLLAALLLARRGVRCAVFERRVAPFLHPRAMSISRRSAEILQQLDLRQPMRQTELGPPEYALANWAESLPGELYGQVPRSIDDPAVVPYGAFHCPQTLTEKVLLEALEREENASIFFDHVVTAMTASDENVRLTVHRGRHDQTFGVSAAYVVAADGAGSPTRQRLSIESIGPGDQGHFVNTYFRAAYGSRLQGRRAVLNHILRRDLFETFVAVNGDDLWLMHHFLQPGEEPMDYPSSRLAEIIRKASGFPDIPVEILSVKPWVMSPKIAAQFRKGRVFLTGDASARLSPAGGLGMNTGLQSAHNLAWKLAAVLRGAPVTLLDSYDAERRDQVMRTFETSNAFGSEMWDILKAGLAGHFDRVRELVSQSRRNGGGLGLDLGWHYKRGAFVPEESKRGAFVPEESNREAFVPEEGGSAATAPPADTSAQAGAELSTDIDLYEPTAEPGRRAPHLWLDRDGDRISSLDLFGAGFTLLTAGESSAWRQAIDADRTHGGYYLEVIPIGGPEGLRDLDDCFLSLYGLIPGGAVLIRPDGVVGWRSVTTAPGELARALSTILAGG